MTRPALPVIVCTVEADPIFYVAPERGGPVVKAGGFDAGGFDAGGFDVADSTIPAAVIHVPQ